MGTISTSFQTILMCSCVDSIFYCSTGFNSRTLMTVQIKLKKMVLNKEVIIKPQLELSKLKPKSKLEELRTAIAGQNQNNVDIELEREVIDAP
jgi:hypothetical protein